MASGAADDIISAMTRVLRCLRSTALIAQEMTRGVSTLTLPRLCLPPLVYPPPMVPFSFPFKKVTCVFLFCFCFSRFTPHSCLPFSVIVFECTYKQFVWFLKCCHVCLFTLNIFIFIETLQQRWFIDLSLHSTLQNNM